MGFISGFTSTMAHAGGPPVTMYLLPQKLPRHIFVGTHVIFFAVLNAVKLVPYGYLGIMNVRHLWTALMLAPFIFAGVQLGIYLNRNFNELWFIRVIYVILFLTGLQLMLGKSLLKVVMGL